MVAVQRHGVSYTNSDSKSFECLKGPFKGHPARARAARVFSLRPKGLGHVRV